MSNKPKILIIEEGFLRKDIEYYLNSVDFDAKLISLNPNIQIKSNKYLDKILNIYNRVVKKNIYYFEEKSIKYKNRFYLNQIKKEIEFLNFDYILLIVPYHYSSQVINYLSKHTNKIIGYSWDSINNKKEHQLIKFNNKISKLFCYDKNSINNFTKLNLIYTTNFYYPLEEIEIYKNTTRPVNKISYVGNLADRRDVVIEEILDNIEGKVEYDINIVKHDFKQSLLKDKYKFNYLEAGISLHDYMKITLNSEIILDIQLGWQNGFTFRIIEASYLKKKIITTNQFATELKFYHPDNIFIYNEETKHLLNDFSLKPYTEIDSSLIEYYRIDNWLKRILELE